jgi:hypothetical protein
MKKLVLIAIMFALGANMLLAQAPQYFNYQAVVRGADDQVMNNKSVSFRFSILKGNANGPTEYMERHTVNTNEYGLVNLKIGDGTVDQGVFKGIPWSGDDYFLKTEMDSDGGNNFTEMSTQQLLTVPYAMHATTVSNSDNSNNNEIQTISLNGSDATLSKGGGTISINDDDSDPGNEFQNLRLIGDSLLITDGNGVRLPTMILRDKDKDTRIWVEKNKDDDVIRFESGGKEYFTITDGRLETHNTGSSIFIGRDAGSNDNLFNSENVVIGDSALAMAPNTDQNIAIGFQSMKLDSSGERNVAIGAESLMNNKVGNSNVAIGGNTMFSMTSGHTNVAVGFRSMYDATGGSTNTGVGAYTLYNNTTGIRNVAIGGWTLDANTTGHSNTAVGHGCLSANTIGVYNVAIGPFTMRENKTGHNNIALGYNALKENVDGDNNVAIGFETLKNKVGTTSVTGVGFKALNSLTTGNYCTAIGYDAARNAQTTHSITAIGNDALLNATKGYSTAVGVASLQATTTGDHNTAIGGGAGKWNTTGGENTFVGYLAGGGTQTYSNSTALGYNTSTTASNQVRIGHNSVTSIGGYRGWSNLSDARFKINIQENVSGLDFILALRPVTYNVNYVALNKFLGVDDLEYDEMVTKPNDSNQKETSDVQSGFIAQEVEATANSLGFQFSGVDAPQNETDHYSLRYAEFVVPLVKSVQEQNEIIVTQEQEIAKLKTKLEELALLVNELLSKSVN